jgi:putative DNA primase/helicase
MTVPNSNPGLGNPSTNGQRIIVDPPSQPDDNAQRFISALFTEPAGRTLLFHRDEYYIWMGTHWVQQDINAVKATVAEFFRHASYWKNTANGPVLEEFNPSLNKNRDIIGSIQDHTYVANADPPSWLTFDLKTGDKTISTRDIIPLRNGLFDVQSRTLQPHTPFFFNLYACEYDYDDDAPQPLEWLAFIESLFGNDLERVHLLQEWLGYILTPDSSLQKMLALIGLPGAGKGTIIRVIRELMGGSSVGTTSIPSLSESHSLENLAERRAIIINDAQSTGRNPEIALEIIANITGEDEVRINPKNKKAYYTTSKARIMMAANRVPNLPDRDAALQRRMLVLKLTKTFKDNPDPDLKDKLSAELSGIFNWAMEGLTRLRARGRFIQPELGKAELELLASGAAPEQEFVKECCVISDEGRVAKDDIFAAWDVWCKRNGHKGRSKNTFLRALYAGYPNLDGRQKTSLHDSRGPQRAAIYGIELTEEASKQYLPPVMPEWMR